MLASKNLKSFLAFSQQLKNVSVPLYGQEALQTYLQRAEEEKKLINQTPILSVQTQVRFIEQNRNIKAQSKYLQQSNMNNYLFDLQQNQINNELALQLNIDHLSIGSLLIQNLKQSELQYINCKISNQSISPIIFVQAIFDHLQELRQIKQDFMLDNLLKNVVYLEKNINDDFIPVLEQILVLLFEMNYLKQSTPIVIASILGSIFELLTRRENLLLNYRERSEIKQTGLSFFQKFNSIYNKSQYQKLQYIDFRNMLFALCLYNHEIPIERQHFIVDEFANFGIKHGNAQKLVELTGYLLICDVQLTQNYFKQILDNRIIRYINFQQLAIMIQAMNQYNHFQTESQIQLYQILYDKLNEKNRDIQKLDFNLDLAFKMVNTIIQMPVMTNKNISEAKIIRLISNLENLCDEDDTLTVNQLFAHCLKLNSIFKYPWALIKEINKQHINLQYDKEQFVEFLELFIDRYHGVEYDLLLNDQINIEAPSDQVIKLVTKLLSMMNEQLLDQRIFETLVKFGLQDYVPLSEFIQQIIQQNLHNLITKQNVFSFVKYINKYKLKLPQVNEKVIGFIDDFQPLQFFEIVYYLEIKEQPKIQKLLIDKIQEFFNLYQASRMNYFKIESFYQTFSQNSQLSYKGLEYIVPLLKNIELEHKDIAKLEQIIERNCKQFYGDILIENLIGITELGIRNINIFKKCVDNITSVFRYNKVTDILGLDGILRNKNFQLKLVQSYLSQVEENESQHYVGYKIIGFFASKVFPDLIDIELIALMKLLGNDPNNYTAELLKQLKSFQFSDKYIFDAARYAPYQEQSFIQYLNKWLQTNKIKTFKQLQSFQNQQIHINNIDSVYISLEKEQPTQIMQIKQQILSYLIDCYQQGIQMEKFMWAANQSYAKLDRQSQMSFIIIKALDQLSKKVHLEVTDHLTLKERHQFKYTKGLLDKIIQLLQTEELGIYRSQIQSNDIEYYPSLVMDKQEVNPRWITGFTPREIESVDQSLLQFLFYQPSVKQNKINAMIKFVIQELIVPQQIVLDNSLKYQQQRQNNQKKDENFINFFGPFWSAIDSDLEPQSTSLCDSSNNAVDISIKRAVKGRSTLDVYLANQQDVVFVNDKVALSPFMQLLALNQSLFNPTLVILYEPWIKKNYTKFIQEKFIQSIIEQL